MLKPRGRKYLFAPAIICQVCLLVDSQSYIGLYSFKILNLNVIRPMHSQLSIFLNELWEECKCINLYTYIGGLHTQFCITGLQERTAHLKNPKCAKIHGGRGIVLDPTEEAYSHPASP